MKKLSDFDIHTSNFHSHTQFCDGRDSMAEIAEVAFVMGMAAWGITPHSPVPVFSPCNMAIAKMDEYYGECERLKELYAGRMEILTSLEIDFLSPEWGPHIDWFQKQPLDYRLGSVHFVPTKEGVPIDCDGCFDNFKVHLEKDFRGDIRYVVEKYFEQVLSMLERGGIDLLGHFDKIAGNASKACPGIEDFGWYEALVDDVISHVSGKEVTVEINTKAFPDTKRFFPNERWWGKLKSAGIHLVIDSDAHYASRVTAGRAEAISRLSEIKGNKSKTSCANQQ